MKFHVIILLLLAVFLVAIETKKNQRRVRQSLKCLKRSTHLIQHLWGKDKGEGKINFLKKKKPKPKVCALKCEDGFTCKRVYEDKCIGANGPSDVPPPGSDCEPQYYEGYCCQFDGYNADKSIKHTTIPIGGSCKLGTGETGTCTKPKGEEYASCTVNKKSAL